MSWKSHLYPPPQNNILLTDTHSKTTFFHAFSSFSQSCPHFQFIIKNQNNYHTHHYHQHNHHPDSNNFHLFPLLHLLHPPPPPPFLLRHILTFTLAIQVGSLNSLGHWEMLGVCHSEWVRREIGVDGKCCLPRWLYIDTGGHVVGHMGSQCGRQWG